MLDVAEALEKVLAEVQPLKPEVTALTSAALGQVLASGQVADLDSPPFAKSMMDGYAVRSTDCATPTELALVGEQAAGQIDAGPLLAGQCVRILTGAPIPPGADAVIKQELCEANGDHVRTRASVVAGQNIFPAGAEYRAGDVVIPAGTVITPATFGLFAAIGKTAVPTVPRPKVGVLVTGNELVEANMKPTGGQIRNSNGPMLVAQAVRAGALPRYLGIARDDRDVMRSLIREGLATSQVLVLSGGVSVGTYDLVPEILHELGVETIFHSVRLKPGKPLLFGRRGKVLVFGLPGNPVSAFVGFELFVRPALEGLSGRHFPSRTFQRPLAEALTISSDRPLYLPAKLHANTVQPLRWLGSADLRSLLNADALLVLPPGDLAYAAGHEVQVMPLN